MKQLITIMIVLLVSCNAYAVRTEDLAVGQIWYMPGLVVDGAKPPWNFPDYGEIDTEWKGASYQYCYFSGDLVNSFFCQSYPCRLIYIYHLYELGTCGSGMTYRYRWSYTFRPAADQTIIDSDGDGTLDDKDPYPYDETLPDDEELGQPDCDGIPPLKSNPVNVINGNKYESQTDIAIQTPFRSGLKFTRYYNSQSDLEGPMGFGWSHSFQFRLDPDIRNDQIRITRGDGRGEYFAEGPVWLETFYMGILGNHSRVDIDGTDYLWKREDGFTYVFDSEGVLQEIRDTSGNRQVMAYDTEGRLETVTDEASGRVLELVYDTNGNIAQVLGPVTAAVPSGIWATYTHVNDNLTSVQYADGSGFDYGYDDINDAHNLTRKEDAAGHVLSQWTYDNQDRVITSQARDAQDLTIAYIDESHTRTTDSYGVERTYAYDRVSGRRKLSILTKNCTNFPEIKVYHPALSD